MKTDTIALFSLLAAACATPPMGHDPGAGSDSEAGPAMRDGDVAFVEADCSDGIDDDGDGVVDGNDTDCPLAGDVDATSADAALEPWSAGKAETVADIDGDGVPDLVGLTVGGDDGWERYVAATLSGEAIALPVVAQGGSKWGYLRGDVDGDGVPDVLHGGASQDGSSLFEVSAGPLTGFGAAPAIHSWTWSVGCAVGDLISTPDLDGDGRRDLAFGSACMDGGVFLLSSAMADGSEITTDHVARLIPEGDSKPGYHMETGDLDGDGAEELVWLDLGYIDIYDQCGRVYVVDLPVAGELPSSDAATAVLEGRSDGFDLEDFALTGDLTGDGYGDLALSPGVLLEGPLSGWMDKAAIESAAWATFGEPHSFYADGVHVSGDIDGDGSPELAFDSGEPVGSEDGRSTVDIYLGVEPGGNEASLRIGATETWNSESLVFGAGFDATGDGLSELVLVSRGNSYDFYVFNGR